MRSCCRRSEIYRVAECEPTKRFTYGYGRAEDFAGLLIVLMIVGSGIVVAYESMMHLWNPPTVQHLWAVGVASVIGFLGNEAVARYRLKVGHEIGSAALIADGHHVRTDALSSLSVLAATFGVWLGMLMADPLVGLLIVAVILKIGWESGVSIVMRMFDGVDPEVTEEVIHAIHHVPGVQDAPKSISEWIRHCSSKQVIILPRRHNISCYIIFDTCPMWWCISTR